MKKKLKGIRVIAQIYGLACLIGGINILFVMIVLMIVQGGIYDGWFFLKTAGISAYPLAVFAGIFYIKGANQLKENNEKWTTSILYGSLIILITALLNIIFLFIGNQHNGIYEILFSIILTIIFLIIICFIPILLILKLKRIKK